MPVATLEKSPEVRRLIRRIKAIAPHLYISVRDRARYNDYMRAKMREQGLPWLALKRGEPAADKPLSDQNPMNATGKSVRPAKASPDRTQDGREIPQRVASGMAAGLTDKPRGK